ncbi:hypothetical protein QTP88_015281 [Uroleucon formosanum]
MEIKRGIIDSENYFCEAFKPIIEPLSTHKKQNEICNTQSTELENKSETSYTSEEDDDNEFNSPFEIFLNNRPKSTRYDKSYVKPLYDRMKMEEKQFNEEIAKINETKTPRINLKTFNNTLPSTPFELFNTKRRKITQENEPFDFNQSASSFSPTDRMSTDMNNFTSSPDPKKGSSLYKDVLPQTQLVYYDDPNELVTRLNLLVSSQSVGNTGVNNEIISILEELRERNIIV